MSTAKAVVIHGNGSMNSLWWRDWFYPKAFCSVVARIANVPVLLTSQGIGPIVGVLDSIVAETLFKCASFIGVRDGDGSADVVKALGTADGLIATTGDDALIELTPNALSDNILAAEKIPNGKLLICVNFRNSSTYVQNSSNQNFSKMASLLDALIKEYNCHIVFVPITYDAWDDDRKSANEVRDRMQHKTQTTTITSEYSAAQLKAIVARMHLSVGTSYHFLLFSLSANVPAVGLHHDIYYCHKQKGLFGLFAQASHTLDFNSTSIQVIFNHIKSMLCRCENIAQELRGQNQALRKQYEQARNRMAQLLN